MAMLRQNPEDPCQLQASYDDGVTWATVFDYSLCLDNETKEIVTVNNAYDMSVEITNNMAIYEGDITNVYNNWGYGDGDDVYRDDALCWALREWVDLVCDLAIKLLHDQLEEDKNFLDTVADALEGVGEIVAIMVSLEYFPAWAVYAALGFSLAGTATEAYSNLLDVDPSVFEDEEAKEEVACAIYNAMAGSTPDFDTWKDALLAHGLTGNAGVIADVSWMWQQSEESFVQFMKFVGPMIDISKNGAGLGCPCDGDWTHIWEFDEGSGGDPHTTYDNDAPQWTGQEGFYDLGEGGWCSVETVQGSWCDERVRLQQDFAPRTLTRVRVDSIYHEGNIPAGQYGRFSLRIFFNMGGLIVIQDYSFALQVEGPKNFTWTGFKENVTAIRVLWRCSWSPDPEACNYGDGSVVVTRVAVDGKGVCPFD